MEVWARWDSPKASPSLVDASLLLPLPTMTMSTQAWGLCTCGLLFLSGHWFPASLPQCTSVTPLKALPPNTTTFRGAGVRVSTYVWGGAQCSRDTNALPKVFTHRNSRESNCVWEEIAGQSGLLWSINLKFRVSQARDLQCQLWNHWKRKRCPMTKAALVCLRVPVLNLRQVRPPNTKNSVCVALSH